MRTNLLCLAAPLLPVAFALGAARAEQPAPPQARAEKGWSFSTDGGKTFTSEAPTVAGGAKATIIAKTELQIADPAAAKWWELAHGIAPRTTMRFELNGADVPLPLKGMHYKVIPAILASLLREGANELTATIEVDNTKPRGVGRERKLVDFTLPVDKTPPTLTGQTLRVQTGPILGAFGPDYFTVTCRTNMPAKVTMTVRPSLLTRFVNVKTATPEELSAMQALLKPHTRTSDSGLYHRFRAPVTAGQGGFTCFLTAVGSGQRTNAIHAVIRVPGITTQVGRKLGHVRFVVAGDSRSRTEDWATVALAVGKARPDFVVFTGDMNDHGTSDWEWDTHFFASEAARMLVREVPFLPIKGNHEEEAAAFTELFYSPSKDGRRDYWAIEVGPVLILGINGQWRQQWHRIATFLDRSMAESKAKYIFLATHYPGWSSAGNGKLDAKGRPTHWGYRNMRDTVVPLLRKHKACAYLAAHEHHYERSDLPGGLYQIIAAGAGAPRSTPVAEAKRQNPYARIFVKSLNFCVFDADEESCTMKALAPDGRILDTLTWKPRKLP